MMTRLKKYAGVAIYTNGEGKKKVTFHAFPESTGKKQLPIITDGDTVHIFRVLPEPMSRLDTIHWVKAHKAFQAEYIQQYLNEIAARIYKIKKSEDLTKDGIDELREVAFVEKAAIS